jgi:hypothetical protein
MIKFKGKKYRPTLMMMYLSLIVIIALSFLVDITSNFLILIPIQITAFTCAVILAIGVMSYE